MLTMDQGIITSREAPLPLALRFFAAFLGIGIGTMIPLAWLVNVSDQTSAPVLVLVAAVAQTVFAPLSLLIVRWVNELEEPLLVKPVPWVGLVACVGLIGFNLAIGGGLVLG